MSYKPNNDSENYLSFSTLKFFDSEKAFKGTIVNRNAALRMEDPLKKESFFIPVS